jgi:nitrate/TMAO reductase-like tetraheme cytochrome c subunit
MKLSGIVLILFFTVYYSLLAKQESGGSPHGNIKMECSECHTTQAWKILADSLDFNHQNTGFPLSGEHTRVGCRECHQILIFSHIGVACVDCHMDVHGGELGSECENCHSPKTWENRQEIFDQHDNTRFPLVGVHSIIDCESCHFQQTPHEYKTTPIECYQCHLEEYQSSKNPDHIAAQFSTDCQTCHPIQATTWSQTDYSHQSYPLLGAHIQVDCLGCHSSGYSGTPTMCEDCHIQDYQASSDPDHEVFGFPRNCEICHNENQWGGTSFDHLAESGFALNGAHATILCNSCHVNNQISGLPRDCIGCHEGDYNSVDDPNHVQAQFSFDCLECHSEQSWTPATFDHNQTQFPLTGAHVAISCIDCHKNNQYTGLPGDCYACHDNDYNATSDPNHQSAGFPVQCEDCHNTNNWEETTWEHDAQYFPIYTGKHREAWDNCVDCHVNSGDYGVFECILCHEHSDQADLADKHKEEQDYEYESQACYSCHPTGNADD